MTNRERRLLGEILMDQGLVNPGQVDEAFRKQRDEYLSRLLGEILMDMGAVTFDQVVGALALQAENGKPRGFVNPPQPPKQPPSV
jgi:hypothetical protein